MAVEGTVKRIGGSTFVLLPPDLVRTLGLKAEGKVLIDVKPLGGKAEDVLALKGRYRGLPRFDRADMWGE